MVERKAIELIVLCEQNGIPIRITEGFRSFKRQQELYNQGRTTPGRRVTNAKPGQSYHNWKCAFDVVFVKTGYNGDWKLFGKLAKSLGFTWGGDFKGLADKPHCELTLGYNHKDFIQNKVNYTRFE